MKPSALSVRAISQSAARMTAQNTTASGSGGRKARKVSSRQCCASRSSSGVVTAMPITSPIRNASDGVTRVAEQELAIRQQDQREQERDQRGADDGGGEQDQHVAQMGQRRIELQILPLRKHGGEQRVAGGDDGGEDDDQRPVDRAFEDHDFGDDDAGEQRDAIGGPRRIITASARPRPGSQAVIGRPLYS